MVVSFPYRLLDGTFTQADFDDMTLTSKADTVASFKFVQWRPKEAVKVRFYIEGDTSNAVAPVFWMNDRQIIDGKITYEKYDNIEYKGFLPSKIKNNSVLFGLGVTAIFVFIEAFAIMLILFIEYCFRLYKYRNWKVKYYASYKSKVGVLFAANTLLKEYEPYTLPNEFWPQITGVPKPKKTARDNQIFLDFILAFLVCLGTLIGILWIFPANWVK